MWLGLTTKRANRAFSGALMRVMILPWLLFGLTMMGVAMLEQMNKIRLLRSLNGQAENLIVLGLWFALSLMVALFFGLLAWWKLNHQFRTRAMERYSSPTRGRG